MLAEIIPKIAGMEAEEKEDSKYYPRPSLAGPDRCIRQMVYWHDNVEREKPGDRIWLIFDDGKWHEELTADWIRKSAFQLHSEQMLVNMGSVNGSELKGRIDGIVTDVLGIDRHYEHKGINHFTFQSYWNGSLPHDYITQCCMYVAGLQKVNPEITESILLIKNKNTAQFLEFLLEYHPDAVLVKGCINSIGEQKEINQLIYFPVGNALAKFEEIERYTIEGTLPDRQYTMSDWQCEYCGYQERCWESFEGEIEQLKENVTLNDGVVKLCKDYLAVNVILKDGEVTKDMLREKIIHAMKEHDAKKGKAGIYSVTLSIGHSTRLNKEMIPQSILALAEKKTSYEKLMVREPKGGKNNGI